MKQTEIDKKVQAYIQAHSGYDVKRDYLGMSGIGRCSRELYDKFFNPTQPTDEIYRGCYLGYLWEDEMKDVLEGAGIYKQNSERELIAPFDARFVGHTDGETKDGNLVEIKSVTSRALERVKQEGRIKREHFAQVQTYMRFGEYFQTLVALVSRDPLEFYFVTVPRVESVGLKMEEKARNVLAAIDAKLRPACECGYCNR